MKRNIKLTIDEDKELSAYIKSTKEGMIALEEENSGIWGNEETYKKAKAFNALEEFEKNILCLYTYTGSYEKMQNYMNIKKSTICMEIKRIKGKL